MLNLSVYETLRYTVKNQAKSDLVMNWATKHEPYKSLLSRQWQLEFLESQKRNKNRQEFQGLK